MVTPSELAQELDAYGITLVNLQDPVDGGDIPALDWEQVGKLMDRLGGANREARAVSLRLAGALARVKEVVDPGNGTFEEPEAVVEDVKAALGEARALREQIEVTPAMVEAFGASFFDPAMVWDRARVNGALASALRAR
ncbi:hypothetical protein SEA_JACKO_21 [Microbacterium phage Jacko]|nr:hypothetical protein SEA_JACKO_21 [Microbacterium phage Jacko]